MFRRPHIARFHGTGIHVSGDVDANGDVGAEPEALFAELRVPGEQVVGGEVGEVGDDCAAGFGGLGEVGGLAWGGIRCGFMYVCVFFGGLFFFFLLGVGWVERGRRDIQFVGRRIQTQPADTLQ